MDNKYDIVIVGMGPAGLAAASKLGGTGLKFAMIDAGKGVYNRDRYDPDDATRGDGGAGLFSDGKFSFFPSASKLWSLPHDSNLKAAYDWACSVLGAAGLDTPPFPKDPSAYSVVDPGTEAWVLKTYPSDYLSLDTRLKLVDDMVSSVAGDVSHECNVEGIQYNSTTDDFTIHLKHERSQKRPFLKSRRLLLATGRFGPLANTLKNLTKHHEFHRLEIGFRIQQTSDKAFFRNMRQLDPKLRIKGADGSAEWRTFCVCRQGETCLTQTGGLWTVSGRSDCPPTGHSNSGFNTRIFDQELAKRATEPLFRALSKSEAHFEISAKGLLRGDVTVTERLDRIYGKELRFKMVDGLQKLSRAFDSLAQDEDAKLIGPTLEG